MAAAAFTTTVMTAAFAAFSVVMMAAVCFTGRFKGTVSQGPYCFIAGTGHPCTEPDAFFLESHLGTHPDAAADKDIHSGFL